MLKINLKKVIHTLSDQAYQTEEGKDATLGYFISKSFDIPLETDQKLTINDKMHLYSVAKKVATNRKEITITAEEAKLVLNRMTPFSIPVVGAISELLT